jgi:hypothetical protein
VRLNGKSGQVAFQPRARLLKLIGEELISDEVVAVSELVKNGHDADASEVVIAFRSVTTEAGEIDVCDDGHGMNLETLLKRWMEPAASTKTGNGRQLTRRGRRVLGEKGVGRFAADKLARHLEIVSRARGSKEEVRAMIDWDVFDDDSLLLAEVKNRWEVRAASAIRKQGTLLRMTGLRSTWTERMFRRLSIRLSRLLSPFRQGDRFTIRIESDEFPQYSGELRADFLQKAPYRIEAVFDGLETISIKVNGRAAIKQRWNGTGELACGPVRIRMYAFDLEAEALAKIGPRTEVRGWLREWTGVSIYRDGFRVLPYGEPHDDWLRLDQRRVNSPVDHLSNNQVIGFIDIGRDRNPDLSDQTNREGLIHNRALDDLRRLVIYSMQALEAERQSIRHPAKRNGSSGDIARQLRQMQKQIEEQARKDTAHQCQVIAGYSGLAAIGQMAAGLAAVLPHELDRIRQLIESTRTILSNRKVPEVRDNLENLAACLGQLEEFQRAMSTVTGNADRRRAIDMVAEARNYQRLIDAWLVNVICCTFYGTSHIFEQAQLEKVVKGRLPARHRSRVVVIADQLLCACQELKATIVLDVVDHALVRIGRLEQDLDLLRSRVDRLLFLRRSFGRIRKHHAQRVLQCGFELPALGRPFCCIRRHAVTEHAARTQIERQAFRGSVRRVHHQDKLGGPVAF